MSVNVEAAVAQTNTKQVTTETGVPLPVAAVDNFPAASASNQPRYDVNKHLDELKSSRRSFWQTINPGYIVAGGAYLWRAFTTAINKNFFSIVKENNRFPYLEEMREAAFASVYDRSEDASKARLSDLLKDATNNERAKPGSIQNAVNKFIKEELAEKDKIRNPLDNWKRLKFHHKQDAILQTIIVTSVGIGAIYSYNRETKLANKLHRQIAKHAEEQMQMQQRG